MLVKYHCGTPKIISLYLLVVSHLLIHSNLSLCLPITVLKWREFTRYFEAGVRQGTGRQETNTSRHGSLPENLYKRELLVSDNAIDEQLNVVSREE